jgi:hypothetical protein
MLRVTAKRATPRVERLHRYWLELARQHRAQRTAMASPDHPAPDHPASDHAATEHDAAESRVKNQTGMKPAPGFSDTLAAANPPPPRSMIDPAAIVSILPHVLLAEFETDPFRVRYRLTGTRIDDATGANLTGKYLDDLATGADAGIFRPMLENYRRAWQSGEAVIDYYHWTTENGRVMPVCYGIFPLTVDGAIRQAIAIEEQAAEDEADPPKPKLRR